MRKILLIFIILPFFSLGQMILEKNSKRNTFQDIQRSFENWCKENNIDNTKGWKWFKRWENHYAQRANPDGSLADPNIFLNEAVIFNNKRKEKDSKFSANWIPVGPNYLPTSPVATSGHGVARINCIAFHPNDPNTFWVGVAQGGIWKTNNSGTSWTPLNEGLPILRISDITVDPINPNILYVCLGDYEYIGVALATDDRKRHTHYGLGVYKSIDGGLNWLPTGLTTAQTTLDNSLLRRLIIDPNNTNNLLAGGFEGVWKSTDGGINWAQTMDSIVSDLEQHPNMPNIVYAATAFINNLQEGVAGVMKSIDFGNTWTFLNTGIPPKNQAQRVELAISPSDPNYVYAIACDMDRGFYGLYRTTNAGANWTQQSNGSLVNILSWYSGVGSTGGQGTYDLTLIVDPSNRDRLYAGGVNCWGSDDGGVSWNGMSYWVNYYGQSIHADQHQFKYNPVDDKFYVCNDGGVMRTDSMIIGSWDDAYNIPGYQWPTSWENLSDGMQITSFYRLGLSDNNSNYVIAGAQDNSTFYYNNNNWINIIGGDGMECIIHPYQPNTIWGMSQYGNLARSYDGGQNIDHNLTGPIFNNGEEGEWITPYLYSKTNNAIYAGFGNLWKSIDDGDTWQMLSNMSNMNGANFPAPASALAQCSNDKDIIYMAKRIYHSYNSKSELWVTKDEGNTWSNITNGLPDSLYFTYLTVDDDNADIAWVTCSGFKAGQKVYNTTNGGVSWTNISQNLPNIPVNTIVLDEQSPNHTIYIGTDLGVYMTHDTLSSGWLLHGTDLPNVIVSELEIDYNTNDLYAATFGRGIWKTDMSIPLLVDEINIANIDIQITPNPNNGRFSINLSSNESYKSRLNVIDVMGKVVYSIEINILLGETVIELKLEQLNSGVYFVQLLHNNTFKSIKFIKE
jgi:photosystem II stability/assembly factor-like uncharacterized protein